MYHYVRPIKKSEYPEIKGLETIGFLNQLEYFKKSFKFGNFSDIFNSLNNNSDIAPNQVLLTFDDGLKDHFSTVFPILKKMNIKGYFFPPSKPIEEKIVLDVHKIHFILSSVLDKNKIIQEIFEFMKKNKINSPHEYFKKLAIPSRFDTKEIVFIKKILQRELPFELRTELTDNLFKKFVSINEQDFSENLYMSINEMKEMSESGMVFGSHTHTHQWLSTLSHSCLINEIEHSKEFCRKIQYNNDELIMCYPYGDFNNKVITEISKRGFKAGLTTEVGDAELSRSQIFKLNRFDTNDFLQ